MDFKKTVRSIRNLEVQGATHVALAAAEAFVSYAQKLKVKNKESFLHQLEETKTTLEETRITEPAMRNILNYIFQVNRKEDVQKIKKELRKRKEEILNKLQQAENQLTKHGAKLIKKDAIIYTHCHSSTVTRIIIAAKKKHPVVHNTETRPRYQGRKTAEEIADAGIKVFHFVDSAVELALEDADIMLIGADAVDEDGVFNKIGSATFAKLAHQKGIPVYVCTTSFKVDEKQDVIELRDPKEVWEKRNSHVHIINPAFDKTELKYITGIVSEFGILKPKEFFRKALKNFKTFK